jgi:nucleoid-associated protein YgaU
MNYRYQNISSIKNSQEGSEYFANNIYPDIPYTENDSYVITVLGDRLDLLAFDFYGDTSYWWVIASANSLSGDSLYLEPGSQIRIPADLSGILNQYRYTNNIR